MTKTKKTKGSPDPVDVHVGKRLRLRRSLLGMSQEKLAESIGLTFQQIQKYEKGTNRISASRLFQFSKILQIPISYFYEQFGKPEHDYVAAQGFSDNEQEPFGGAEDAIAADIMQSKETLTLVRAYYEIKDEAVRKHFLQLLKSMSQNA